jgi:hypothetical protein
MSTSARNAQGAVLTVGATGSAKTITAITQANPAVVTATAHGFTEGTIVVFSSVTGMTQMNARVCVVRNVTANTFEAAGIDSTSFSAYASGGSATPNAVTVGNFKSWNGYDGQNSEIDVTDLSSTAKQFRAGLYDPGQLQITVQYLHNTADQGQDALRASQIASGPASSFVLTFKDGKTITATGFVKQFSNSGQVDGVVESNITIRLTGQPVYA